jgi:uncharacterized protein (TIGR00369 family)
MEAHMSMPDDSGLAVLTNGRRADTLQVPVHQALGIEMRDASPGSAVARLPVSDQLTAPSGALLPGAFAILADVCCGLAAFTAMPSDSAVVTAQLRVEFVCPLALGRAWIEGRAQADAVDDNSGLARAEILDEAGQLLGVASLRMMKVARDQPHARPGAGRLQSPAFHAAVAPDEGLLGVVSRRADSGQAAWRFRPAAFSANSYQMMHGGVLGLLAHEVATDALQSVVGPGQGLVPLDLVVQFFRGVPVSGGISAATAQVAHRGRRFVVAEGEITGPDGRPAVRLSAGAQVREGSEA